MARIEDLEAAELVTDDAVLIYRWIALNALYGRWNEERREPDADGWALDQFLKRIFERDDERRLETLLLEHKKLAESIVSDEHLNRHYWSEPGESAAQRARSGIHRLREAYREKRYRGAMDMTLDCKARDAYLQGQGYEVLRIPAREVLETPFEVIHRIGGRLS